MWIAYGDFIHVQEPEFVPGIGLSTNNTSNLLKTFYLNPTS